MSEPKEYYVTVSSSYRETFLVRARSKDEARERVEHPDFYDEPVQEDGDMDREIIHIVEAE